VGEPPRPPFLAKVYAFKILDGFTPIYPLYGVMFVARGLTPFEVSATLMAWSITAFALQIPAGIAADRWSRRWILAIGQVLRAVGFVAWLVWPTFAGFLVGMVLWGVKSALTSGTFESLVYDELAQDGRPRDYARVMGRAQGLGFAAILLAALGAAAMVGLGYPAVLIASIATGLAAGVAALILPRAVKRLDIASRHYLGHLREGFAYILKHPALPALVGFMCLSLAFGGGLEGFWPIFAAKAGLATAGVSLFVAAVSAAEAAGAALAHRLGQAPRAVFHGLFALIGLLIAVAAAGFAPWSVGLLVVLCGLFKVIDVNFDARLHGLIPTETRATIASVKSFIHQVILTLFLIAFGPLAQATSYRTAFLACGGVMAAIGVGWMLGARREKQKPHPL
jgi:MFS family permease